MNSLFYSIWIDLLVSAEIWHLQVLKWVKSFAKFRLYVWHNSIAPVFFNQDPKADKSHCIELPSRPDTVLLLLTGFITMARSMSSGSTVLDLPHLFWWSRVLKPEWNFLYHLVTRPWSSAPSPFTQQKFSPIGWGCSISPQTRVLEHLMVRL